MVCTEFMFIPFVYPANTRGIFAEYVRAVIQTGDCPSLELVFRCVINSPDIPPDRTINAFEDATEQEAIEQRCMVNSQLYKMLLDLTVGL
jgi:hypothetical protein